MFINRQSLAEQWLQLELSQADGHRAWLLQTWADEDVEPELGAPPVSAAQLGGRAVLCWGGASGGHERPWEAVGGHGHSATCGGRELLLLPRWLWAALARDRNEALAQLVANDAENIHHRVVAALALGRLEDAVGLYLSQELLAEAQGTSSRHVHMSRPNKQNPKEKSQRERV